LKKHLLALNRQAAIETALLAAIFSSACWVALMMFGQGRFEGEYRSPT
jgi:hypothetical protein